MRKRLRMVWVRAIPPTSKKEIMKTTTTRTIRDYLPETRDLLQSLHQAGFKLIAFDNGGGEWESITSMEQAETEILGVDECTVLVTHPITTKRRVIFLVYGNSPGELAADWTDCPEMGAIITAHSDRWEGTEQRMQEVQS